VPVRPASAHPRISDEGVTVGGYARQRIAPLQSGKAEQRHGVRPLYSLVTPHIEIERGEIRGPAEQAAVLGEVGNDVPSVAGVRPAVARIELSDRAHARNPIGL
jgi:hypothetical protein